MKKSKPPKEVRIAVIGAGYWGKNLIRNFYSVPGGSLVAVCDNNPKAYSGLKKLSSNRRAEPGYLLEPDRERSIRKAVEIANTTDIILIAGKGHEDYQIIGREKRHFDDREVAADAAS